jgi:hypothetical protein
MVQGLRVVFAPTTQLEYPHRVPIAGAHGTVTAARTAEGVRTYFHGPGGGLVFVRWDPDGLVCAVTLRDLKLEPDSDR